MIHGGILPRFPNDGLSGTFHVVLPGNCEKSQNPLGMNGQMKLTMSEE